LSHDRFTPSHDSPEAFARAASARFDIVRKLGSGGFGAVYEAIDRATGGRVAIKTIREVQGEELYLFKQEFRALTDLVHPNLVQLYELGSVEGRWFFTMELVEGADFVTGVRRDEGGFDEARLRSALLQLSTGLSALHQAGRLHRDIKPPNVLVTPAGRAVIVDFGLSVRLARSAELSRAALLGTPEYVAPEQVQGAPASEASDWYAVGAVLWEALVGRPAFRGGLDQVLAQKLMAEPPPPSSLVEGVPRDLDKLCVELLRRAPEQRPSGAEILAGLGAPGKAARRRLPFVGRAPELAAIGERVRALRDDRQPAVVLVRGASGLGKSALLREARAEARGIAPGALILASRCHEQESVPYKALDGLTDALSRHLGQLPESLLTALLPPDAPALVRAFPVFAQVRALAEAPAPFSGGDPQALRRRAFRALRELLARLGAQRPLLLVIDDLQWGDEESGAALGELLSPPVPPLLLLAAYRSDAEDISACLVAALPRLRALGDAHLSTLDLAALSDDAARELARAALPPSAPDEVADAVVREALGQPLLVRAMASVATDRPPTAGLSLDAYLAERVAALPEAPRRLLETISIAGKPVHRAAAELCAGVAGEGRAALKVLRAAHLARRRDVGSREEIEPYHDRVREVVAAGVPPERQASLFQRLAAALTAAGTAEPETLASYCLRGGDLARAAELSTQAAHEAGEALAFDRAVRLYRQALTLLPSPDPRRSALEEAVGEALANAGRGAEAASAFEAAAEGAPTERAVALRRRAATERIISGHVEEGMAAFRRTLAEAGIRVPEGRLGQILGIAWGLVFLTVRGFDLRERPASAVDPRALLQVEVYVSAIKAFAGVDWLLAACFSVRVVRLALRVGEPRGAFDALILFVALLGAAGQRLYPLLRRAGRAAESLAAELPGPHTEGWLQIADGFKALMRGALPAARAAMESGSALLRTSGVGETWVLDVACELLCRFHEVAGDWGALAARLPADLAEARGRGDRYLERQLLLRFGHIPGLLADRPDEAALAHTSARQGFWPAAFSTLHHFALLSHTDLLLYEEHGRGPAAHRALHAAWPALQRSGLLRFEAAATVQLTARARAALAFAADPAASAPDREAALLTARAAGRRLARFAQPMARASAAMVEAGLAAARGEREKAATHLATAAAGYAAGGSAHYAAASRRQQGTLLGGEAGEAMRQEGEARLAAEGAKAPERLARMLVPVG
jgi:hypothetical protein